MGHIVVGVDESPAAAEALRWAVREGEYRSCSVTAVMAWGYLDQRHATGEGFRPNYSAQDAAVVLSQLVDRADARHAAAIVRKAVCDLPARALLEASESADMLVVGARGYGSFRGLLLGSVSQQCAHHTPVPIAIVRNAERRGFADRSRIVVGVDGSPTSLRALAWALDEGRARDAAVTVVHAWQPALLGAIEYAAPVLDDHSLQMAAKETVDSALAESSTEGLSSPVATVIVDGEAADAILAAARDAALAVVGSRGRGGFSSLLLGSVSQRVIDNAECPVVVIPPEDRRPAHLDTAGS